MKLSDRLCANCGHARDLHNASGNKCLYHMGSCQCPRFSYRQVLSDHDKENIGDIICGSGDHFSAHLLRLISKSDTQNRNLIAKVFPEHVEAYLVWAFDAEADDLDEEEYNSDDFMDRDQAAQDDYTGREGPK